MNEFDTISSETKGLWENEMFWRLTSTSALEHFLPPCAPPPLSWWRRQLNRLRLPWNLRAFGFQLRFGRERDFDE